MGIKFLDKEFNSELERNQHLYEHKDSLLAKGSAYLLAIVLGPIIGIIIGLIVYAIAKSTILTVGIVLGVPVLWLLALYGMNHDIKRFSDNYENALITTKEKIKKANQKKEYNDLKHIPAELIIAAITKDPNDMKTEPLTLIKLGFDNDDVPTYYLVDKDRKNRRFSVGREELMSALTENKNNLSSTFATILDTKNKLHKEQLIEEEKNKLENRRNNRIIREEAEKRLYGKARLKNREPLSNEEKEMIFDKFNNECVTCGRTEGLHIHHRDHNPANNSFSNLIVLCGVCHKKVHMNVR